MGDYVTPIYPASLYILWFACLFHMLNFMGHILLLSGRAYFIKCKKMSYGNKISFFLLCLSNQCTITYVLYNPRVMNLLLLLFLLVCECVCVLLGKSHKLGSLAPPIVFIP